MPYVERKIIAGRTVSIERYFTARYKSKNTGRAPWQKPTSEQQEKGNSRRAAEKLTNLINTNFGYQDFHVVLDYPRGEGIPERTAEEMKKDFARFLREVQKQCKKIGVVFKFIRVMEIGERGARHHHVVCNRIDTRIIQDAWAKAYEGSSWVRIQPLDNSGDYSKLASYLIKYTDRNKRGTSGALLGKRWTSSRNLTKPTVKYKIVKDRDSFRTEPKPLKGYTIVKDSVYYGVTDPEHFGYGYLRYRMVMLD